MNIIPIILASLLIMIVSLSGVLFLWGRFRDFVNKNLGLLVSFSAGVFLVVVFSLMSEVFNESGSATNSVIYILIGFLGVLFLFKLLPNFHHHHNEDYETHTHSKIDARKIVFSDVIHNIGDGILLASAFSINLSIGIIAAFSILIHEFVQEVSEFFVLKHAGFSTQKTLAINLIASSSILIGSLGGFFLLNIFQNLEIPLLGIAAGAFLVVVIQDLIPESIRHSQKEKKYFKHLVFFILGLTLMFSINLLTRGGHTHSGGDHSEEEHGHEDDHDEEHLDEHHDGEEGYLDEEPADNEFHLESAFSN